jgi:acetolactate synthase-1/2/3 large subunit
VDLVLAVGVRYSEVSTGFYAIPKKRVIQVDVNPRNLGRVVQAEVCVAADAGAFLGHLLEHGDLLRRPADERLARRIAHLEEADYRRHAKVYGTHGADPMAFVLALRRCLCDDALVFVDVTLTEHLAAEAFPVWQPRTYFNPTDNQAMGWAIPAALGAQRVQPARQTVAVVGDGCFLMSAMELTTAAREGLPVKVFVLDDQAYTYMQVLQRQAYLRTTATVLARMDYAALAQGLGVGYQEVHDTAGLEGGIRGALAQPGPVLVRVVTDYGDRPIRWIDAVRQRFIDELTPAQQARFAARLGRRALDLRPEAND